MKNCKSSVTVTNGKTGADEFYWRNENEYHNLGADSSAIVSEAMAECQKDLDKIKGNSPDGLTATLTATVDGAALPTITKTGMSFAELAHIQRRALEWAKKADDQHGKKWDAKHTKK